MNKILYIWKASEARWDSWERPIIFKRITNTSRQKWKKCWMRKFCHLSGKAVQANKSHWIWYSLYHIGHTPYIVHIRVWCDSPNKFHTDLEYNFKEQQWFSSQVFYNMQFVKKFWYIIFLIFVTFFEVSFAATESCQLGIQWHALC